MAGLAATSSRARVTNALQHAKGEISVTVEEGERFLRISVGTDDGDIPDTALRPAHTMDECGRGLNIVDAFSENWGVTDGRVWCTISHSLMGAVDA
ncbi:ATP-binding protein [Streptomyces sp. NPDC005065]|uniref:ATP-binding protein n=1 Tax=Streptomyces sp. NPDC005065 TaxID=3154461 RepID=UPI0033A5062B